MNAETAFARCLAGPEESLDLARAALLIARAEYPQLDVEAYLARLDALAAEVRRRLAGEAPAGAVLSALNRYLFEEQGFTGNVDDYYDPRNSFLNEVMDRKLGIPLTLSLLYMELGRRLGVALEGVAFPGHFLVRLHREDGDVVLDPFFGGIALSRADLEGRIQDLLGQHRSGDVNPRWFLESAGKKQILARMLRNLKIIYLRRNDLGRALAASNQILAVDPSSAADLRDRGMILEYLECPAAALADYLSYLQLSPQAEDAEEIRSRLLTLRRALPMVH